MKKILKKIAKFNLIKSEQGFTALIFMLVMSSLILLVAVSAAIMSVEGLQLTYWQNESARTARAASACIEEGLLRLSNSFGDYSFSLSIGSDSCTINIKTDGGMATLESQGIYEPYHYRIRALVDNQLNFHSYSN